MEPINMGDKGPSNLSDGDLDAIAERVAEIIDERSSPGLPQLYTQRQIARALSVSERTVDNLVAAGELVPVRVTPSRKARRFARANLEAFIRSRTGRRGGGQ